MSKKKGILVSFCVFLLVSGGLSFGINAWVYSEVQKRLDIKIGGNYVPAIFLPSFTVKNANFLWKDKVKLVTGDLEASFNIFSVVSDKGVRIKIKSQNCDIKFVGKWANLQGVEDVLLKDFFADIAIDFNGISEIYQISAMSPEFQFSIKKK